MVLEPKNLDEADEDNSSVLAYSVFSCYKSSRTPLKQSIQGTDDDISHETGSDMGTSETE